MCLLMQLAQVQSLDWEDPLEQEMATHSSILAWRLPLTEEPSGLVHGVTKKSDISEHKHTQRKRLRQIFCLLKLARIYSVLKGKKASCEKTCWKIIHFIDHFIDLFIFENLCKQVCVYNICVYLYTHIHMCCIYQQTHAVRGVISKQLTSAVLYEPQIRTVAGCCDTCVQYVSTEEIYRVIQHTVNNDSLWCGRW